MTKEELLGKMAELLDQYEESHDNQVMGCLVELPVSQELRSKKSGSIPRKDLYEWDGEKFVPRENYAIRLEPEEEE